MLYHVSPVRNIGSIERIGLLPQRAEGEKKVVWLCDFERLAWSLVHVSLKKHIYITLLNVWVVSVDKSMLTRTAWRGIFTVNTVLQPNHFLSADEVICQISTWEISRTKEAREVDIPF